MNIQHFVSFAALFLLLGVPSVSHASALSGFGEWFSSASASVQTADVIAANSPWLDVQANGDDGPLPVYDGMEVELRWVVTDVFNVYTCSLSYPAQSGWVTESVTAFGSKTVSLYPSNSPVMYIDFVCNGNNQMGHDAVLITKTERPTTPPPSPGTAGYSGSGHGGFGPGGTQVIQVGVPVTSGNTFQYTGTGGSGSPGSINFGGILQGITGGVQNIQNTVGGITNGITNNTTNNSGLWGRLTYGTTHAYNAAQTYAIQPTQNWINNHIINPIRNFLGFGNGQTSTDGSSAGANSTGNGQGSAQGSGNTNRNTTNSAPSGSSGGTYRVHVGPLSNGASGPADGSNDCNGGTDNCNNNNNPYGFEQDPSKVQNTNDSR